MNFREMLGKICLVTNPNVTTTTSSNISLPCNGFLGIPYVDKSKGIQFLLLAETFYHKGEYAITETLNNKRITVNYSDYYQFPIVVQTNKAIIKAYENELNSFITNLQEDKNIVECRKIYELDEFRNPTHPDLLKAQLFNKDGIPIESIEVMTRKYVGTANSQHCIVVELMSEPYKNIGLHKGDLVLGCVAKTDLDDRVFCIFVGVEDIQKFNEDLKNHNLDEVTASGYYAI